MNILNNKFVGDPPSSPSSFHSQNLIEYIVKKDDTLTKIALKFNTTIGVISTLNSLSSYMIYPSQVLYIPNEEEENTESHCLTPTRENNAEPFVQDRSPLFPGLMQPLKLCRQIKEYSEGYYLTIYEGCIRLTSSLFSITNPDDKKLVELIINPTCITISLCPSSRKENFITSNALYDGYKFKNKYIIPFKSIQEFKFYNSVEGLLTDNVNDYPCDPVPSYEETQRSKPPSRMSSRLRRSSVENSKPGIKPFLSIPLDDNLFDHSMRKQAKNPHESQTYIVGENLAIYQNTTGSNLPCENNRAKETIQVSFKEQGESSVDQTYNKLRTPQPILRKKFDKLRWKSTSQGPDSKGNGTSLKTIISKKQKKQMEKADYMGNNKSPRIKIENVDASSNVYVCVRIRQGSIINSIDIFRDFEQLFQVDDPKLLFEISLNHLMVFREFVATHLFQFNPIYGDKNSKINSIRESFPKVAKDVDSTFITIPKGASSSSIDMLLPKLNRPSNILSPFLLSKLSDYFPRQAMFQPMTLAYGTLVHGTSIRTLYRKMLNYNEVPSLLVIKDDYDTIFGAILSCIPKISTSIYGNGECILFKKSLENEVKFYPWTVKNEYFIQGDYTYLAIGADKNGYGIWLNEDLVRGRSSYCETFDNDILSHNEDFYCKILEIWVFDGGIIDN